MNYAVNRIYSSEQARFLQPDPIGMASVDLTDPQTLNLYTYARNNPIDFTDPTGLYGGAIISNCRVKCWETSVEILDDGDGSGALFSNVRSSSGCTMTCSVSWVLVQPELPSGEESGGGYSGGGLGLQDDYPGRKRNPIARWGDCLKLNAPGFEALPKAARTLLDNTFGAVAPLIYRFFFSTYKKAVFVNTVVAAAYVKADFSNAKFGGFYSADGTPNGIYVTGLKGIKRGRHKIGKKDEWNLASVEYEDDHIDVDLYHSKSFRGAVAHFFLEVLRNKIRRKGTRPWDVAKKLKDKAKINTGVSCKRK